MLGNKKILHKFIPLIIYSINIFASDINEEPAFRNKCEEAGGTFTTKNNYKNERCRCGSPQGRYFNFKYSKCFKNKHIYDLEKNDAPSVIVNSVTDFASLLNSYEKNVCYSDYETLKNGALLVLKNAMDKLGIPWQKPSDKNNDFKNLFLNNWQLILDALDKHVKADQDHDILLALYLPQNTLAAGTLGNIRLAFEKGLISLPVLGPNDEAFKFRAIKNGLLIGVAPIIIQFNSIAEMQKSYKFVHPFRPFVRNASYLAYHDALHAELMSDNLLRLGLSPKGDIDWYFSEHKCQIIKTIIDKLAKTKVENNSAAKTLWAPLYFYIHENHFYFAERSPFNLSEFIFELWQNRREKSLPGIIFGNDTDENKGYLQDLCHQIYEKRNKSKSINFDFLKEFMTSFPLFAEDNDNIKQNPLTKKIAFQGITSRLADICAFNYRINPLKEKQIELYKYDLSVETNKALKIINFEKDFAKFHTDFLELFREFNRIAEELVPDIDRDIWLKWHRNENHLGQKFKD